MFNGKTFGFINGNITILSLIVGMYASGANKKSILGAMVALLIADPLCDAYSLYIAEKEDGNKDAYESSKQAFLSQLYVQLLYIIILYFSSNSQNGVKYSLILGFSSIVYHGINQNLDNNEQMNNLVGVIILISISYFSDKFVSKYF